MQAFEGTLLVVDDFELNRDMLSRRLKSRGFRVHAAEHGQTAMKMIKDLPSLDLVLLDIMMPDIDGFQILEKIREKFTSTQLAVIMVTAKDQSEDIVKALALGADDYVTKPIDFPVALARIQNQLDRRRAEAALQESEERYALAAKGANDGLWDWDLRTDAVHYSDRWKTMLGYDVHEIGDTIDEWFNRVHPDDLIRLRQELDRHLRGDSATFSCEYRMVCKDCNYRWLLTRGSAVADEKQVHCRMVGWQTDSNDRVAHDSLTALPNRGLFLDRIAWALARSRRSEEEFAVFYLGIDRFKVVNESLGHARADHVLVQMSRRIEMLLRPEDTLARMGGDEFAILLADTAGVGSATQVAERLSLAMDLPFTVDDHEAHLTLSLGIFLGNKDNEDPERILRLAHQAMDAAKTRGKNCYEFYRDAMDETMVSTLEMENELRKALDKNELFLHYQPQISGATGRIVGVEALIRWNSSKYGFISPAHMIPLAEESGLIVPIGTWVIEEACRQNKRWQDAGLPPIRVAVNVSSRQFRQAQKLLETVDQTLKQTGLKPCWLDLEMTESLLMDNVDQTIKYLQDFHDLGIQISLDDFGTGYSSLSRLKRFPIDVLKIDQSFVRDITDDPDDAAICSAIISMAHTMRMTVIAEGVETAEHLKFLTDLDCDELQGYHFSKPTKAADIAQMLEENRTFIQGMN